MTHVYIGCALTHVKKEHFNKYTSFIKNLARMIENEFNIKCKYALRDSDPKLGEYSECERPKLCYEWDRKMVEESSLIIAEVSFPSTGLGMEIEIANQNSIPVILIYGKYSNAQAESKEYTLDDKRKFNLEIGNKIVSVMVQGCPTVISEINYSSSIDGIRKVRDFLNNTPIDIF